MIIVVSQWKQKVLRLLAALIIILAFAAAIPVVTGKMQQYIPAASGWFEEEHPTGNPLRVENEESSTRYEEVMDQFVIKLQDFYYQERD